MSQSQEFYSDPNNVLRKELQQLAQASELELAAVRSTYQFRTMDKTIGELKAEMRDLEKQLVLSKIGLA